MPQCVGHVNENIQLTRFMQKYVIWFLITETTDIIYVKDHIKKQK